MNTASNAIALRTLDDFSDFLDFLIIFNSQKYAYRFGFAFSWLALTGRTQNNGSNAFLTGSFIV